MKPYPVLDTLFSHNLWANLRLVEVCAALSEEQLAASAVGGYGSIGETLQHFVRAEESYLYRIRTGQPLVRSGGKPPLTMTELQESLQASGDGLIEWASKVRDDDTVQIQWDNEPLNELVDVPKAVILTQAINHATEHRAQIMTILTQLGIEPPELSGWAYFEARELQH